MSLSATAYANCLPPHAAARFCGLRVDECRFACAARRGARAPGSTIVATGRSTAATCISRA